VSNLVEIYVWGTQHQRYSYSVTGGAFFAVICPPSARVAPPYGAESGAIGAVGWLGGAGRLPNYRAAPTQPNQPNQPTLAPTGTQLSSDQISHYRLALANSQLLLGEIVKA